MDILDTKFLNDNRANFLKIISLFKPSINDSIFRKYFESVFELFDDKIKIIEKLIEHKKLMSIFNTGEDPETDLFYFNYFTPVSIECLEIELEETKEILKELTTKYEEWKNSIRDNNLN